MTDIALIWDGIGADIAIANNDIVMDDTPATATLISIFTDARAAQSDSLPDGQVSRRGWWGDLYSTVTPDAIGSKLWLLYREKQTEQVRETAIGYVKDCLQWAIDDRLTDRIDVDGAWIKPGMLGLSVVIYKPQTDKVQYRFNQAWDAALASVAAESSFAAPTSGYTLANQIIAGPGLFITIDDDGTPLTAS